MLDLEAKLEAYKSFKEMYEGLCHKELGSPTMKNLFLSERLMHSNHNT